MSLKNIRGEYINNPINEVRTKYTYDNYNRSSKNAKEFSGDTVSEQNIFTGDPISQYDTLYNSESRPKLEQLRVQTESYNQALEAALVPSITDGFSLQPFMLMDNTNTDGETITSRVCTSDYVFSDHTVNISDREYVFKCNMVKFKSDRTKRLIYDRYVHIYTKSGDTVKSLEENLIFKYDKRMTYEKFMTLNPHMKEYGFEDPMEEGVIINTGIPSTLYNLVDLGYVFPFLGFINNRAVSWNDTYISVDTVDIFVILNLSNWEEAYVPSPTNKFRIEFKYLDLPFQVDYVRSGDSIYTEDEDGNRTYHLDESYLNKTPIFFFGTTTGGMYTDEEYDFYAMNVEGFTNKNWFERIYTKDNHIIYEEFNMDENALGNSSISKLGVLYNKRFTEFDYRFKIKQFNLLCFEETTNGYELRDDFNVESHQFNIMKIELDKLFTNKRRFKIFYNTRVIYDQDNIFRIKNLDYLSDQFAQYMEDATSNVEVFIREVYSLMKKDIGIYLDDIGNEYSYDHELKLFTSTTTNTTYKPKEYIETVGTIEPEDPTLLKKYSDQEYDRFKIRTEIVHFNNIEEGSTPSDEFIYYFNPECTELLKEIANQIFKSDEQIVKDTIYNLIDLALWSNYKASPYYNGKDFRNEWFLRKNLSEMFKFTLSEGYAFNNMSLLDEVFDFTYSDQNSYKENLEHGLQYVVGYDADKIESSILNSIVSMTKRGDELTQFIDEENILTMSRWNLCKNNNYVMIFKNGELYPKYNTIYYTLTTFSVEMTEEDYSPDDKFEFVFFLNATNDILPVTYNSITVPLNFTSHQYSGTDPTGGLKDGYADGTGSNSTTKTMNAIPCNTSIIDPENLMVMINKLPDNSYNGQINFNNETTAYAIDYTIESYKAYMKSEVINGNLTTFVVEELSPDEKINGVYRVTKQGGGEYFIKPLNEAIINPYGSSELIPPQNITLCSKRQFRYGRVMIEAASEYVEIDLSEDFKYCTYQDQFMIFKNYRLVSPTSIVAHPVNNSNIDKHRLYLNVPVEPNDVIDIFYITNGLLRLNPINSTTTNNINNETIYNIPSSNYIRFKSPLYAHSNKYSLFVFLNGRKVPVSDMEDISATIIKLTTDQPSKNRLEIFSHIDNEDVKRVSIKDGLSHDPNKIETIDLTDLDTYNESGKVDRLINTADDNTLNKLFDNYSFATDNEEPKYNEYYSKQQVLDRILEDFILSTIPSEWITVI